MARDPHELTEPLPLHVSAPISVALLAVATLILCAFVIPAIIKASAPRAQSNTEQHEEITSWPAAVASTAQYALAAEQAPASTARHRADFVGDEVPTFLGGNVVSGHVPIRGTVVSEDGSPVAHATVTLIGEQGNQIAKSATDTTGRYSVHAPCHTSYLLVVATSARQPKALPVSAVAEPISLDVTLTGTTRLCGVVRSAGLNRPIVGAAVTVLDAHGELVGMHHTAPNGEYAFGAIAAGTYTVAVSAEFYHPHATTVSASYSDETRHDVELTGAIKLEGVARSDDACPIANAQITLYDPDSNIVAVTRTNTAGEYCFDDLSAGDYTVVARGYPSVASAVALAGGHHGRHDVELGYFDDTTADAKETHSCTTLAH